jgi:uncharacterized zinc-type alcohol dehydrogenase-like protein
MDSRIVESYAALAAGQPLVPFSYAAPALGGHEIRIEVSHCGVCYSDIHAIDDRFDITAYPFVPGHEIVGSVSEIGQDVTEFQVGDRVGVGWQGRSCGTCEWCRRGEEQLCKQVAKNGVWMPYGGFATSTVADSRFAYPLPNGLPAEDACVLLCAGITVYHALIRQRTPDLQHIGILGVGGLGHLAIQFAHAMGYRITAMSSSDSKKEEALAFGADDFLCTAEKDAFTHRGETFDLLFCTAHGSVRWNRLLECLKKHGKLILMGFPDMSFNPNDLVVHELTIQGSFIGNRAHMRDMLAFAQQHHIRPVIETMPMAKVNEAIERTRENKARYRIVLVSEHHQSG